MSCVNLYVLSRLHDIQLFSNYEQALSRKRIFKETKQYEQKSLISLVNNLLECSIDIVDLDGFYYGFTINQISKEFDLLKISNDHSSIINIELKSNAIPEEKIKKQLLQNRHYLRHISSNVYSYTYIASENQLYNLDCENELKKCDFNSLTCALKSFSRFFDEDLNSLFKICDYLVSPLNSTEKFINQEYFLTNQQDEFKKTILNDLQKRGSNQFLGITGYAGTGKTLLLYDIARECSMLGLVCIIHCGILCEGHRKLGGKLANIDIIPIKDVNKTSDISKYMFIFIDESQRIRLEQFNIIIEAARGNEIPCLFSFDSNQILSKSEETRNVPQKIIDLKSKIYTLSNKIRTNKELADFMRSLFNRNFLNDNFHYDNVEIIWANDSDEAELMIEYYKGKDYVFINYTSSQYKSTQFDIYDGADNYTTHQVLGQEFDNVLILLNNIFYYNENKELSSKAHPYPNYLYYKLLFQAITRTREHLCIIIIGNEGLFEEVLSIKVGKNK